MANHLKDISSLLERGPDPASVSSTLHLHLTSSLNVTNRNSLAYMEAYIALASVMRRFSLELFETDASDIEVAHDFFLPCAKLDSKGIRMKVLSVDG